MVSRFGMQIATGGYDRIDVWYSNATHAGTNPDQSSSSIGLLSFPTLNYFQIDANSGKVFQLVEQVIYNNEKTDAECLNLVNGIAAALIPPADTTPPNLTNPTGSATGPTTASGTVATDEGVGTMWGLCSTNATETAATIKASGTSQAVTSTGVKTFTRTGLTASTAYYWHYVQEDAASPANTSNVAHSAQFTTPAAADTTPPTLSNPTAAANGSTGATLGVTTNEANGSLWYYVSANATETLATIKASGAFQTVTATGAQTVNKTGLTANTSYYAHYAHTDAAGNDSNVVHSAQFTTAAASSGGTITWPCFIAPINGNPRLSAGHRIAVYNMTTDALVVKKTGLTTDASTGVPPPITDPLIVAGTQYRCHLILDADNAASGTEVITAT
jgi:hypothetical protein